MLRVLLVAIIGIVSVASATEVALEKPSLTLSGHYTHEDGRVETHKFPIKMQLLPDGTCKGTYQTWIEKRELSGRGQLMFSDVPFQGKWKTEKGVIQITLAPHKVAYDELKIKNLTINGLRVEFQYENALDK